MTEAGSVVPYGSPIDLACAREVAAAAEAEALRNGWPMVICVVDSTGHVVILERMDHAQYGSIDAARAKAETAVNFKRSTQVFESGIAGGGIGMRALTLPGVCAVEGGLPLYREGKIVGAIGVSGAKPVEDGQVAQAGAAVLA
jgi:uncharacterized protein GlcG (DUF336 family)